MLASVHAATPISAETAFAMSYHVRAGVWSEYGRFTKVFPSKPPSKHLKTAQVHLNQSCGCGSNVRPTMSYSSYDLVLSKCYRLFCYLHGSFTLLQVPVMF